jgi:hypothetical protein
MHQDTAGCRVENSPMMLLRARLNWFDAEFGENQFGGAVGFLEMRIA